MHTQSSPHTFASPARWCCDTLTQHAMSESMRRIFLLLSAPWKPKQNYRSFSVQSYYLYISCTFRGKTPVCLLELPEQLDGPTHGNNTTCFFISLYWRWMWLKRVRDVSRSEQSFASWQCRRKHYGGAYSRFPLWRVVSDFCVFKPQKRCHRLL